MPISNTIGTGIRIPRDRDACSIFALHPPRWLLYPLLAGLILWMASGAALAGASHDGGPWSAGLPHDSIPATSTKGENTRLVASGLALFLGPFGAHRLYLGTTPKVAVIYGVTFGGFGVLPLIDLGHLVFSKDLEPFRNSDRVFMWSNRAKHPGGHSGEAP